MDLPKIKVSKKTILTLREHGLLDEIVFRNFFIKREFMKRSKRSKNKKRIIEAIADKFNMSPKTVKDIIYQKTIRKKPLFIPEEFL